MLAGFFAGALLLGLLIGDRLYFRTLSLEASRYGCRVGRGEYRLNAVTPSEIQQRFDGTGILALRHGVARVFADAQRILLRPRHPTLWAFLWVWPMKVTIDVRQDGQAVVLSSTRRIPWCSAILTGAWFAVVGIGTVATLVSYAVEGGLSSGGGVVMALGILTLGLFFLFSGVVTVIMAYRMENNRVARASQELFEALTGGPSLPVNSR